MKKTEILYQLIHSKDSFFSKEEKIKLIKSQAPDPQQSENIKLHLFRERYESFLKLIADIMVVLDQKGNILKTYITDDYISIISHEPQLDNISKYISNESSCGFFAKLNQCIKQSKSFSINLEIPIKHNPHQFEGLITYYKNKECIIFATDISVTHKNLELPKNLIDHKIESLISEKKQLELSNKKLLSRNKDLLDSITYAKKIQRAIFPEPKTFRKIFKDSFILFDPKDIVSGDLYWFEKYDDTIVLAVVDCTGHGVPGAFIATLAYSLMNKILSEKNVRFKQPSELLSELHFEISNVLNIGKGDTEVKDGMDIGLCLINPAHSLLYFSGAFHNLYHVSKGRLNIIKGDKLSVGGGNYGKKDIFRFNTTMINYDVNDAFYLTTDGYLDQFGGEKDKKFLNRRFRNMIEKNHQKPMEEQINIFKQQYNHWKGDNEQVDDVLVAGFKCSF